MTTGSWILLGFVGVTGAAFALLLRRLAHELHARRTLTRAEGVVEHVELSKGGRTSGSRVTVRFVDAHGQERRFRSGWSEAVLSMGERVRVGYRLAGGMPPQVLTTRALVESLVVTLVSGALSGAALFVLVRTWLRS